MRYLFLLLCVIGCGQGENLAYDLLLGTEAEQDAAIEILDDDAYFQQGFDKVAHADGTDHSHAGDTDCYARDHGRVRGHICITRADTPTEPETPGLIPDLIGWHWYRYELYQWNVLVKSGRHYKYKRTTAQQDALNASDRYSGYSITWRWNWEQFNTRYWEITGNGNQYRLVLRRN